MNLLPCPRSLHPTGTFYALPTQLQLTLASDLPLDAVALPLLRRLREVAEPLGCEIEVAFGASGLARIEATGSRTALSARNPSAHRKLADKAVRAPHGGGYVIGISTSGVVVRYDDSAGLRHGFATFRQLIREYGRRLPCLKIEDWPEFPHRGVMLDISRGRVPRLETLLDLVERLADFKINELQLYTEHTFAYRGYEAVWRAWSALTGAEVRRLDGRCRELGIELVPNQNSFGHLREWFRHPRLRQLAEVSGPYQPPRADFIRHPSTLAPNHPGTLPFLRSLYDHLLPNFTSNRFNVGCDETWDLGLGQSKALCERRGKGRVYLDFLLRVHRELRRRGKQMQFWGDIVLHYPELIHELPRDSIALNWGYEADHPFEQDAERSAKAGVPFYVCPGTSTWMTMIGKHDNAFRNLRRAADAGRKHGALGYLITDWGDGGHPQPLAVSWPLFVLGAALSWCGKTCDGRVLPAVLSRDVYDDPTGRLACAALDLGLAHQQLDYREANCTPLGAVIAAPPPELCEIFCRNGLKYFARIPRKNVLAAREAIERQRAMLRRAAPTTTAGKILATELDLAARLAVQSCDFMLWQQAVAAGRTAEARRRSEGGIASLSGMQEEFESFWPVRNKGTAFRHWPFLKWRIRNYRRSDGDWATTNCTKAKNVEPFSRL